MMAVFQPVVELALSVYQKNKSKKPHQNKFMKIQLQNLRIMHFIFPLAFYVLLRGVGNKGRSS